MTAHARVCRLSGHDMNRCWDAPDPVLHAPVYHLKRLLATSMSLTGVDLFCDVHGHSRKEGIFMYGCVPSSQTAVSRNLPRVLPMIMSKSCSAFSYGSCDFKVRVVAARLFSAPLVFQLVLWPRSDPSQQSVHCTSGRILRTGYHALVHAGSLAMWPQQPALSYNW
jgi:hypothetical protein